MDFSLGSIRATGAFLARPSGFSFGTEPLKKSRKIYVIYFPGDFSQRPAWKSNPLAKAERLVGKCARANPELI
jgi:hypothetical protein